MVEPNEKKDSKNFKECCKDWDDGDWREWRRHHRRFHRGGGCGGGAVYGMGFIGALIFYISHATSFWMGVWGIIQAIFWPGFLIYEALKALIK